MGRDDHRKDERGRPASQLGSWLGRARQGPQLAACVSDVCGRHAREADQPIRCVAVGAERCGTIHSRISGRRNPVMSHNSAQEPRQAKLWDITRLTFW